LDREYLEDSEHKERIEYKRFERKILEGKFSFEYDRFPPNERFLNLQKPVALAARGPAEMNIIWAQVPFCGSLLLILAPAPKSLFEELYFKTSEIPRVIDFIRETGRLQVALSTWPTQYVGLDHFDPFFKELNPPICHLVPSSIFESEKEFHKDADVFISLAKVGLLDFLNKQSQEVTSRSLLPVLSSCLATYLDLKRIQCSFVKDIENLVIDDPGIALVLLTICSMFITESIRDVRSDSRNFTLQQTKLAQALPPAYRPKRIQFPCEIGTFLLKKLTYAPKGLRACNELIDEYDAYDLRKTLESFNEAIISNHPDVINKSAEELSDILDNIWSDKTIPKRIENIKIGVPLSIAAIGSVAGAVVGGLSGAAAGGFLAELGFKVTEKSIEKFFDVKGEKLSEKLAKLRTKSYQANIYDFKKKYKSKIASA
jgi:hypothetical protein